MLGLGEGMGKGIWRGKVVTSERKRRSCCGNGGEEVVGRREECLLNQQVNHFPILSSDWFAEPKHSGKFKTYVKF